MKGEMGTALLDVSRAECAKYDTNRDLWECRDRVHHLTRIGMPADEIAAAVGISERSVVRHRAQSAPPQRPRLYNADLADAARVRELDSAANVALQLAATLREEDPCIVWGALTRLTRRQLQELAVIALAAIPVQLTKQQLLQWVSDIGEDNA